MNETWFSRRTKGEKSLIVTASIVLAIVLIAGLIGLTVKVLTPAAVPTVPGDTAPPATETEDPGAAEDEGTGSGAGADEAFDAADMKVKRDQNGMVEMPVTTNPAEAAAGAAAVAFNVDTTKLTRQEYFELAIERMTQPSPKYVGSRGEIQTWATGGGMTGEPLEFFYRPPSDVLHDAVKDCGNNAKGRLCMNWTLANDEAYDMARHDGMIVKGEPVLVMSENEMREWHPAAVRDREGSAQDFTPDTPGVTLTKWYVLSNVGQGRAEEGAQVHGSASLALSVWVWCDAPEEGGLCGVVTMPREKSLPKVWPTRS